MPAEPQRLPGGDPVPAEPEHPSRGVPAGGGPEGAPDAAPAPGGPDRARGPEAASAPRRRRRGPRRATGGTFTGAEPRLPGLDGQGSAGDEQTADGERAHEQWLRAQRPPHWD
ncbi:hypothetical protein [Kocuria sp. NPDC057446]|uniref:hypothetical protein n=1 Tax=Kocuria sp. NPDC057446 TaxID=3346137 RepID=UPI003692F65E